MPPLTGLGNALGINSWHRSDLAAPPSSKREDRTGWPETPAENNTGLLQKSKRPHCFKGLTGLYHPETKAVKLEPTDLDTKRGTKICF